MVLVLLVFFLSEKNTQAQTITTNLSETIRDKSDLLVGFNRRSDKGTWWTDTSFKDLVADMNPDIVRYPAGTQANYWDWSTGKFLDNTDKNWNDKEVLKIPGFLAVLPSRTKAVYVVNMARPTPATGISVTASEAVLKSQATLDAKIIDMLAAIYVFDAQGKLPYAIELGNEFYFGNEESGIFHIVEDAENGKFYSGWDIENNQPFESVNKKDATVINAKFYLNQCKDIVAEIKEQYPSIKFILTTTKEEENAASRERWNTTIFDELENNSNYTSLKNDIYAVTQHHYIKNDGLQTPITDNSTSKIAIAEGIEYPISKQSDYDLVPNDYKIWITEYGAVKEIAEETWASAVRYAAFTYGWIELGDKIEQLDWHYISDNNVVNSTSPMKLAPIGIAIKLFSLASADMTEMQQINFSPNPVSVNTVKSLYGYKFKNASKETLLIINTNDSDFSDVNISNLTSYTGQPTITQYYSNLPYVSPVYDGHSNIVSSFSNVTNSVNIKKFSISVVEIPYSTLGIEDENLSNVNVYPNPVSNEIFFDSDAQIVSVEFWNMSGVLVQTFKNISNNRLNVSILSTGQYIVKVKTEKGVEVKKILKI